jgi:heterodisulfide reductase subunit A-like polyferredoxin
MLSKKPLFHGGTVAEVDEKKCVGCLTCVRTCPFHIPRIDEDRIGIGKLPGAAYIEPSQCHGCGTCTVECPANAIQLVNYRDDQVMVPENPILGSWLSL